MNIVPMLLLAPVLVAVAYFDLRFMRIPNGLTLITLGVLALIILFFPPADLWARLAIAGLVFALGCVGFAFRMVGGGDVKILSALMLAVPTSGIAVFANVFSVSLITGIILVLTLRRFPIVAKLGWKSFGGSTKFPMGLSIAMAGLAFPLVTLATQVS
ncbi:MAG: prepilin peptidase [Paracoccaceae bacterium]